MDTKQRHLPSTTVREVLKEAFGLLVAAVFFGTAITLLFGLVAGW